MTSSKSYQGLFIVAADIVLAVVGALAVGALVSPDGWTAAWEKGLCVAAFAWGVCELFVRRMRMRLTGHVMLTVFALAALIAVMDWQPHDEVWWMAKALIAGIVATAIHWIRFRVPSAPALVLFFCAGMWQAVLDVHFPDAQLTVEVMVFGIFGLFAMACALVLDASDVDRRTDRSSQAYWLHLFAAAFLASCLFDAVNVLDDAMHGVRAASALAVFGCFAIVALVLDRGIWLLVAVLYAAWAGAAEAHGQSAMSEAMMGAAMTLAVVSLLLWAWWSPVRHGLLRRLPRFVVDRVPPEVERR